jgi:hypothetical protein
MTDDRKIGILTPRARLQGAAHSLQAADRAQVSASPQPEPSETAQRTTPAKASKRRVTKTAQPASAATRVQLAADVTTDLRGRARAAFRHAAFHEAVPTFSQFVANALEADQAHRDRVQRRRHAPARQRRPPARAPHRS